MKLLPLLFALVAAGSAIGQNAIPSTTPPGGAPTQASKTDGPEMVPDPDNPKRCKFVELTLGRGGAQPFGKVVDELAAWVRRGPGELENVLFSPGTDQIIVPTLTFRNVTGVEALQMVAASVGCNIEPISSNDSGKVIGWRIEPRARHEGSGRSSMFGGGPTQTAAPSAGFGAPVPGSAPVPMAGNGSSSGAGFGFEPVTSAPVAGNFGSGSFGTASGGPAGMPGAYVPQATVTNVYSLGSLTDGTLSDDMRALEDALKMTLENAAVPEEKPRLSLHEKTRVLIVKGGPQSQQLVASFLDALRQNRTNATSGELADAKANVMRMKEMANMREDEMQNQMKRMEAQISALDAERKAVARENEALRMKLQLSAPPADTGKQ